MKNNKRLKHQQNYKKELQDYENSINDTQILHLRNMLCDIYDCTGWCATTLKEYIRCANHENNMRDNPIWYVPNSTDFRAYLNIKLV